MLRLGSTCAPLHFRVICCRRSERFSSERCSRGERRDCARAGGFPSRGSASRETERVRVTERVTERARGVSESRQRINGIEAATGLEGSMGRPQPPQGLAGTGGGQTPAPPRSTLRRLPLRDARGRDARGRDARGRFARGRDARGRDARGRDARGHSLFDGCPRLFDGYPSVTRGGDKQLSASRSRSRSLAR